MDEGTLKSCVYRSGMEVNQTVNGCFVLIVCLPKKCIPPDIYKTPSLIPVGKEKMPLHSFFKLPPCKALLNFLLESWMQINKF